MKKEAVLDRITNIVAGGGISYPFWEYHLQHIGTIAQALVPVLSSIWLAVQIIGQMRRRWRQ
jgi:hypothetical protein